MSEQFTPKVYGRTGPIKPASNPDQPEYWGQYCFEVSIWNDTEKIWFHTVGPYKNDKKANDALRRCSLFLIDSLKELDGQDLTSEILDQKVKQFVWREKR